MTRPDPLANGDFEIGPRFEPDLSGPADAPCGKVYAFTMESRDSKIYPGIRRLNNEITKRRDAYGNRMAALDHEQSEPAPYRRTVWVYVPAQYVAGTPAPFILVQDGYFYQSRMPQVLDRMIASGRVPALISIMLDSGGSDAQGSQRGLEYDTLSGRYSEFVETELLPRVVQETGVSLTTDPNGRAVMGASSGAACAFTMAWFHPERYRRVLSYSGTYVNQQSPPNPDSPRGAWDYHATFIPQSTPKPLRIWLEVGEQDLHPDDPEETWHNWPLANQRMAAALAAKGYNYRFTLSRGGRHADPRVLDHTLPDALTWLWQDFQP